MSLVVFSSQILNAPATRTHAFASALSLLVFASVLALLWLGNWLKSGLPEKVEVREVSLFSPPPPPPPPVTQQTQDVPPLQLEVEGTGPSIEIEKVAPEVDLKELEIPVETKTPEWQNLEIDWNALDLSDLDQLPTLISPMRVNFPKSLKRRGVTSALVKLDIVIDVKGRVELVNILENPYPELAREIRRGISTARFTVPKKDGETVRARFTWPVEIRS